MGLYCTSKLGVRDECSASLLDRFTSRGNSTVTHEIRLVTSQCQICRSRSLQERCPGCTTRRWIYFAHSYPKNRGNKKYPKYQTGQEERQLQNFDCALGMIVWAHIFTALESAPTPTACCAASTNPWTETI